jgi:phosphoserine phosphatase
LDDLRDTDASAASLGGTSRAVEQHAREADLERDRLLIATFTKRQALEFVLRAHDFTVFIVSAGSTDFAQLVAERAYGIPRGTR